MMPETTAGLIDPNLSPSILLRTSSMWLDEIPLRYRLATIVSIVMVRRLNFGTIAFS
jgi:hypothetical protein